MSGGHSGRNSRIRSHSPTPGAKSLVKRMAAVPRGDWPALLALGREAGALEDRDDRLSALDWYADIVTNWRGFTKTLGKELAAGTVDVVDDGHAG